VLHESLVSRPPFPFLILAHAAGTSPPLPRYSRDIRPISSKAKSEPHGAHRVRRRFVLVSSLGFICSLGRILRSIQLLQASD